MSDLIVGMGEVGSALKELIPEADGKDLAPGTWRNIAYDFIHICIPYSKDFIAECQSWHKQTISALIIHSTVPVGTTRKVGPKAVHSPVHGKHPKLAQGLRTFVKLVGGVTREVAVAAQFRLWQAGMLTVTVDSPETSELSKLCCTLQYGLSIMMATEIRKLCQQLDADFNTVYSEWNQEYNRGYMKLGHPEVSRPRLQPCEGKIGGHCVIPNAEMLPGELSEILLEWNQRQ